MRASLDGPYAMVSMVVVVDMLILREKMLVSREL